MLLAGGLFAAALLVIASERMDRTKVALAGAGLVVATGTIEQAPAIEAIDWNTLGLLAGMMVMVRITEATGVYAWMAVRAAQLSRGRSLPIVVSLAVNTALLSAFLDNVTTVLLVVPITFLLADTLDIDPVPLVILEILVANSGGTATLIGDPPNILIAGATDLSFMAFVVHLAPIATVVAVVVTAGVYAAFRGRLVVAPEARRRVLELDARRSIEDAAELRRTMPVLVGTIVLFFAHRTVGLEPATVALTGATVMLLVSRRPVERALAGIEWPTLFFFIGLFVMVGALERTGVMREVAEGVGALTGGERAAELLGILWASGLASGIVDNIPFTAAMIPVVEVLQDGAAGDDAYWWALALGACLGGNATIVGAACNVAAAGLAARAGRPIAFMAFLRVGLLVMLASMLLSTAYIGLRYL